jgi:hypothetical protein
MVESPLQVVTTLSGIEFAVIARRNSNQFSTDVLVKGLKR